MISTCRREPPEETTPVVDQIIAFDYFLKVEAETDVDATLPSLTSKLHDALAVEYLDCRYEEGSSLFFVYEQSSLPGEMVNSTGCPSVNQEIGVDCYLINAAFTSNHFEYKSRRRKLAEVITDQDVLDSFSVSLERIFSSSNTTLLGPRVVSVQYIGITNDQVPVVPEKDWTGVIVGCVFGGFILIALLVGALVVGRKRQHQREQFGEQLAAIEAIDKAIQDDGSLRDRQEGTPFMVVDDDESFGSGFQIMPVATNANQEPTFFVPTDDMISAIQQDLGPKPYDSPGGARSVRDYGVSDTVDL